MSYAIAASRELNNLIMFYIYSQLNRLRVTIPSSPCLTFHNRKKGVALYRWFRRIPARNLTLLLNNFLDPQRVWEYLSPTYHGIRPE